MIPAGVKTVLMDVVICEECLLALCGVVSPIWFQLVPCGIIWYQVVCDMGYNLMNSTGVLDCDMVTRANKFNLQILYLLPHCSCHNNNTYVQNCQPDFWTCDGITM